MIKILYTIETHGPGGAESVIVNLASSFNNDFFQAYGLFIKEGWIADQFRERQFPVKVYKNKYFFDIPLIVNLVLYIKKKKIDIIHAHEFTMGFYSTLASQLTGIPCVTTFHGKSEGSLKKKARYLAFKYILKKAATVSVSYNLKEWIGSNYALPKPLNAIHNGIDISAFTGNIGIKRDKAAICRKIGLPDDSVLVANVARLFAVKGVEVLVEAAELVLKDASNVHFLIAGNGPERENLIKLAESKGIAEKVHFLGECDIVPQILSASDIFVLSSHSEGLSISILEAMASRLPVVATDVGDNRHLVIDGENGFIVQPNKPLLLAKKIQHLILNADLRMSFGKQSRAIVKEKFDNHIMIDQYKKLYKNLTARVV